MRQPGGRLFATSRGGRSHLDAYLDDYAFLIQALLDLYETDFDERWLREALALESVVHERFQDAEKGGWFTTASDHETLIARLKNPHDGALPSGNGVHCLNLLRLAEWTGRGELALRAEAAIRSLGALVNHYPAAFSQLLMAVDFLAAGPREIVVAGDPSSPEVQAMLAIVRRTFLPQRVVASAHAGADSSLIPLLDGKPAGTTGARAYVCLNYSCREPVDSPDALGRVLREG
jgi:uncharacterized protein YyaL (SSP411 family)